MSRRSPAADGLGPLVLGALLAGPAAASGQTLSAEDSLLAAEIYAEMVEIPSVSGSEDSQRILAVTAARLEAAGIETEIAGPDSAQVLVARLPGPETGPRSSCSPTSTSSRRCAKTGPSTRSRSYSTTAGGTAAARRTTRPARRSSSST